MVQLALRLLPPAATPDERVDEPVVIESTGVESPRRVESAMVERSSPSRPARPTLAIAPSPRTATIARLRALVGEQGRVGVLPPRQDPDVALAHGAVSTRVAGLDRWLRGWPIPGPIEIVGAFGAGRLAPILPFLAHLTRQGRTVLFVDPLHQLHPPALGADPSRLVLVRPPGERAAWAAEQVARSGAVDALVVLDAPALGRGGVRLTRAAEAGAVPVFVLAERSDPELPAALRLSAEGWEEGLLRLRCTRSRDGRQLGERRVRLDEAAVVTGSRREEGLVAATG